jgi:hypothetical protein
MSLGAKAPLRSGSGVVVADGQRVADLSLKLSRGAVLTGTVYDTDGRPMPGVPVMAWEIRTALSGERTLSMPRTGGEAFPTDDRGMFRLFGLPPGEYTVGTAWFFRGASAVVPSDEEIRAAFALTSGTTSVQAGTGPARPAGAGAAANAPAAVPPSTRAYSPVWAPDTTDPLGAQTYRLAAGDERTDVDIRMQFLPMSSLEVTFADADGSTPRVEMALSRMSSLEALNSGQITFNSSGRYQFGHLAAGNYGLVVFAEATADKPARSTSMPVTIAGTEPVMLAITLQPQAPVIARTVFEGSVLPPPLLSTARVILQAVRGSIGSVNSVRSTTDAAGVATITGIAPGRYRVVASIPGQSQTAPNAWNVKSVFADGADVTDLPLTIPPGSSPAITVTFTDQISEVSGRIVQASGQPGTDYFVVAIPADRQYWVAGSRRVISARPDISGRYVFRGLPAGEYRIAVTTELDSQDLGDATALERLLPASAPVTIGVGEKKTFDIKLGGGSTWS